MCDAVRRRVAEIHMAEVEDRACWAAAQGYNLAVAPVVLGEIEEGAPPVMSVKTHLQFLRPGIPAPAGWTLYETAKLHPVLIAIGSIAKHAYRVVTGRDLCLPCNGTGIQSTKSCFWCEGRGFRL